MPLLLLGSGCVCLLLLCVVGLGTFGLGILPALLGGGGTPVAALPTPLAIVTRTTPAPPPPVGPTSHATPALGPTSRSTPPAGPTSRSTAAGTTGSLTAVQFAPGILVDDDSAVDPLDSFPAGSTVIYAVFAYTQMSDGTPYRLEWLKNGEVQSDLKSSGFWQDGAVGNWWSTLKNSGGISPGVWQFNFYVDNRIATSGKMTVEPAGQPNFTSIVFAGGKDANDQPIDPATVTSPRIDAGIMRLYAFFDGVSVPPGTQYTTQWFYNGKSLTDKKNYNWSLQPNENNFLSIFNTDGTPLEAGTYELKLWMGARLVKLAAVAVVVP